MKILDFSNCKFNDNLSQRRKRCTIRLGDTLEYSENEIVLVTSGDKFAQRKKLYTAVIDKIFVKTLAHLTDQDCSGEHPELHSIHVVQEFLEGIYGKKVLQTDVVTVIYFSEVVFSLSESINCIRQT